MDKLWKNCEKCSKIKETAVLVCFKMVGRHMEWKLRLPFRRYRKMKKIFLKIIFIVMLFFLIARVDVKALDEESILQTEEDMKQDAEDETSISEMPEMEIVGEWEEGASSQVPEDLYVPAISLFSDMQFSGNYGDQLSVFETNIYHELNAFKDYSLVVSIDVATGDEFCFSTTYGALKDGTYVNEDEYETTRVKLRSQVFRAADAYLKDTMEVYWIRSISYQATISYTRTSATEEGTQLDAKISKIKIKPNYYYDGILDEIEDVNQRFIGVAESINAQQYENRYDLVQRIYNCVKEMAQYNYDDLDMPYNQTLTGILLDKYEHKCTCEGYAKLIKCLCDYYAIPSGLVVGGSSIDAQGNIYVNHIWNVIEMEDGRWYLVDATWDDTGGGEWYFLAGDNTIGISGSEVCRDHMGSSFFSYIDYAPFSLPVLAEDGYEKNKEVELEAVGDFCAQVTGYNKIQLTWGNVDGADGYIIYRRVEDEESFSYLYMVNKTDFLDIKAVMGKYNYYRVYPYYINAQGERILGKSETMVYGVPKLSAVTSLTAEPSGKRKVKLLWEAVPGAEGYLIYAQKEGKYGYIGMTTLGTTFIDKQALDNDYNFYWVFPYVRNASDKMVPGGCEKYVYAKGVCQAVSNLKASSVANAVKLTWSAVSGADGYLIYGIYPGKGYGYIGMTTRGTTFTDGNASEEDYNFYWVYPYHYDANRNMIVGGTAHYVYGKARGALNIPSISVS